MSDSEINPIEFYKMRAIIHEGFRYRYKCMVRIRGEILPPSRYEKWECDHVKNGCRAYIICDSWKIDEERVRIYYKHNHPKIEEWEDYYGYMYTFTEDKPYPDFSLRGLTPPRRALSYLDKPL